MPEYERSQLRITVWPGDPVPVPAVPLWEVEASDGFLHFGSIIGEAEPPDELYLRELVELDLDDSDAIAEFIAAYGRMGPTRTFVQAARWEGLPERELLNLRRLTKTIDDRSLHYAQKNNLHPATPWDVDAFRLYARPLRAMAKHWAAYSADERAASIKRAWTTEGLSADRIGVAWLHFQDFLNAGLQPFHVRVRTYYSPRDVDPLTRADLYSALCLQLANHVAEGATVRRCANERCGRFFHRQRGRAVHGHHRTEGVRFCSKECARSQAVRDHRRRQKTAGKATPRGRKDR